MNTPEIRIGTRGSVLALAQASLVIEALDQVGLRGVAVIVETDGDRRAPDTAWGEGAFVTAIERAVLAGEVDVAVHSAKDVPTEEDERLRIGAYLPRADPRDALIVRADSDARRLDDLQKGVRVGTDSPRRTGFVLARRPDLLVHPLHGNLDTRLRRLDAGETDALVLACAGLDRMDLGARIVERLDPEVVPPAPGQGAIAVQARRDDPSTLDLILRIDDAATRLAVEAERAFLTTSGGGCRAPIGALATINDGQIELLGGYASPDGTDTAVGRRRGPIAESMAITRALATDLGSRMRPVSASAARPVGCRTGTPRVLVTRPLDQSSDLNAELRTQGLDPVSVPAIAVEFERPGGDLDRAVRRLGAYDWVVITSANGASAIADAAGPVGASLDATRWAVVGSATRRRLERGGIDVAFQPSTGSAQALGAELLLRDGDSILVISGDLSDRDLVDTLRARGARVDDVIAYRTREAPESSRSSLRLAMDGPIGAVIFTSGSTVRGLMALGGAEDLDVISIPSVCIGPETADAARAAGFQVLAVSSVPTSAALAAAAAEALRTQPLGVP